MYPSRYQLNELTAHLVALLERRRGAIEKWDAEAEAQLTTEATSALADAKKAFFEIADDPPYWERMERTLLTVVLPRYLRLAEAEHAKELAGYGVWRGGDLVARLAYAAVGLVAAVVVWRLNVPKILEPLPLAIFVGGPLFPDLQVWLQRRKFTSALARIVEDMSAEQSDGRAYQPVGVDEGATGVSSLPPSQNSTVGQSRDKT